MPSSPSQSRRSALVAALDSERARTLVDLLAKAADSPTFRSDRADLAVRPARDRLVRIIERPWRRLAEDVTHAGDDPSDVMLHRIQIRTRRARYAVEAAEPILGRRARRVADALAELQHTLGAHHDTVMAEAWLRSAVAADPATGLLAGQLLAHERRERAALRQRWRPAWVAAVAARPSRWLR
jgi:CHAD domain-containing protein